MKNETTEAIARCDTDELNNFYSRFETAATLAPPGNLDGMVKEVDKGMSFTVRDVKLQLNVINTNKTPGLDDIHPRSLKIGATSLAVPLHQLFMRSATEQTVPNIWK